jgi:hypothetical protein
LNKEIKMSDSGSAHVAAQAHKRLTEQAAALKGLGGQERIAVGFVRAATDGLSNWHVPDDVAQVLGMRSPYLSDDGAKAMKTALYLMAMQLQKLGYDLERDFELKIGHNDTPHTGLSSLDHP